MPSPKTASMGEKPDEAVQPAVDIPVYFVTTSLERLKTGDTAVIAQLATEFKWDTLFGYVVRNVFEIKPIAAFFKFFFKR